MSDLIASLPEPLRDILARLKAPGAFMGMTWRTTAKPSRHNTNRSLTKVTTAVVRTGIQYANISSVALRLAEEGRTAEDLTLPWGEWVVYPLLIANKGEYYLRVAPVPGKVMKAEYFIDDRAATRDEWYALQPPSAAPKPDAPRPEVLTIKVSNIVNILT
jgi:hypothetical protein